MLKKSAALICFGVTVFLHAGAEARYIVKPKAELCGLAQYSGGLEECVPKLGLYSADSVSELDADLFEFIEEDAEVELLDTYDYSVLSARPEYASTGIQAMWNIGVYGRGIRIGVIDSGCNPHEIISQNLRVGADFSGGSGDTLDSIDHGTAVCGVIAAGYGAKNLIGTARRSEIIPLKFIDRGADGSVAGGTTSRLANAIIAAADDFDCDIINMSLGTINSHTLAAAVDYAAEKGVIMVAAAGNSGNASLNYPAAYDEVIGVGSVNGSKEHSDFSNINESVFVVAPGENMELLSGTDGFKAGRGTSFSAPYICGIIADMAEIKPNLTAGEARAIISETAEDLGDVGYDNTFGYGLVRADAIEDYLLRDCKCFVSAAELCDTDNFTEVRFRFGGINHAKCILAQYDNGVLKNVSSKAEKISDNIFMLRMETEPECHLKYFVWNDLISMKPMIP